jgi:hypothetical protein
LLVCTVNIGRASFLYFKIKNNYEIRVNKCFFLIAKPGGAHNPSTQDTETGVS